MAVNVSEEKYLIALIRCALRGEDAPKIPDGVSVLNVFSLAKQHNVIELISYAVPSITPALDPKLLAAVEKLKFTGVAKEIHQDKELSDILACFSKNGIDALPLKGAVMKSLYPTPDMRSMCDIDILLRKNQLSRARELMINELGYKKEDTVVGEHDIGFKKPPFVSIELHHSVTDTDANKKAYVYYKDVWSLAVKSAENEHVYRLSNEDFYIHHIEHLTKHYRYGGCGIRAFADIYVFLKKYNDTLDWNYIKEVFEKMELLEFSEHVKTAALCWFDDGEADEKTEIIERYVMHGANFGLFEDNEIATNARLYSNGKKMSKIKYLFGRIFLPYKQMKLAYPILSKLPFLLPFFWIGRIFMRLLFRRSRIKEQLAVDEISSKTEAYINHVSSVGLKP